jgi:hypothetical protein
LAGDFTSGFVLESCGNSGGFGGEPVTVALSADIFSASGSWKDADQNQHDEPHAFLAVIRTMGEAHARAGEHRDASNPRAADFTDRRSFL